MRARKNPMMVADRWQRPWSELERHAWAGLARLARTRASGYEAGKGDGRTSEYWDAADALAAAYGGRPSEWDALGSLLLGAASRDRDTMPAVADLDRMVSSPSEDVVRGLRSVCASSPESGVPRARLAAELAQAEARVEMLEELLERSVGTFDPDRVIELAEREFGDGEAPDLEEAEEMARCAAESLALTGIMRDLMDDQIEAELDCWRERRAECVTQAQPSRLEGLSPEISEDDAR